MPVSADPAHFAADSQPGWDAALLEIEHQAQYWDTPDHLETGRLIAQALRAAARLAVGEDPAAIRVQFDHFHGDHRRRLMGAADVLLAVLEDAPHFRDFRFIRGDLVQLRNDVKRLRRTLERQPGICEFWR